MPERLPRLPPWPLNNRVPFSVRPFGFDSKGTPKCKGQEGIPEEPSCEWWVSGLLIRIGQNPKGPKDLIIMYLGYGQ